MSKIKQLGVTHFLLAVIAALLLYLAWPSTPPVQAAGEGKVMFLWGVGADSDAAGVTSLLVNVKAYVNRGYRVVGYTTAQDSFNVMHYVMLTR